MAKRKLSLPECIGKILRAAIADSDMTTEQLGKMCGVHFNTVRSDLRDPCKIDLARLTLYFQALDVPADKCLQAFAESYAVHLVTSKFEG